MEGIGYVWVIRVLFLVAIIAPFAKKALSSNRQRLFGLSFGFCYIAYEFAARYFLGANNGWLGVILKEFVFYAVPYGLIMVISMSMRQLNLRRRFLGAVLLLLMFACMVGWFYITAGAFVPSQRYKYPPTFYYLSYAVGVSLLLSGLVELLQIGSTFLGRILAWIGKRTMWTYLWHISILYLLSWVHFESNFIIMFLVVCIAAVSIVVIQERILKLILTRVLNDETRRRTAMVFSG
jgi:peptidoglycan/LPS O-acetylase OafA/YrhL